MRIFRIAAKSSRNSVVMAFLNGGGTFFDPIFKSTIDVLIDMENALPTPPRNDVEAAKFFTSGAGYFVGNDKVIAYIVAINALMVSDTNVQAAFGYWRHLIKHTSDAQGARRITSAGIPLSANAIRDITSIVSLSGGYQSTQKLQYPMFSELLKEFTRKIAAAANATNPTLASSVMGNGLLDIRKLTTALDGKMMKPSSDMYAVSKRLIDSIMNGKYDVAKFAAQNFQLVKEGLMKPFGVLGKNTMEQETDIMRKRKEEELNRMDPSKIDPSKPIPPPAMATEEMHQYNVDDAQWTSPVFLAAINAFFTTYYQEIAKLERG